MNTSVDRAARKYVTLTFEDLPADAHVEVNFGGADWFPTEGQDQQRSILVAGPDAAKGDALFVLSTSCRVVARVTDYPEILPLPAGSLLLTSLLSS